MVKSKNWNVDYLESVPEKDGSLDKADQNYIASSYNKDTDEQLDYYIDERNCNIGDIAYLYSHEDKEAIKMKIIKIICRSDNVDYYDRLISDNDVLLNGEDKYHADTSAEFGGDQMVAVWCKDNFGVTIYTNYDFVEEEEPIRESELQDGEYIQQMTMSALLILMEKQNEVI